MLALQIKQGGWSTTTRWVVGGRRAELAPGRTRSRSPRLRAPGESAPLMRAETGNRMLAVPSPSQDLLNKLEAVRL